MGKYDDVEATEPQRSDFLRECYEQIKAWKLKMPTGEPLVLDFGIRDFRRIGEIEFWIANEVELGYCGKFLFLFEGQRCPCHYHRMKHETFYVVRGRIEMTVDETARIMSVGDVLVMDTGRRHTFVGLEPSLILEVSLPSVKQDNFFDDNRIGEDGVI